MIKRIVLGDMHGHIDHVKDIYDYEKPDEVIMLGDYLDSGSVLLKDQYKAFDELIKMKENHKDPNKFILLIGNHDFHYIFNGEYYSGYKIETQQLCGNILKSAVIEDKDIIPIYVDNNIIFSHAGVTNTWMTLHNLKLEDVNKIDSMRDLHKFRFTGWNMYGDDPKNSPIWVRPNSLISDMYGDYKQIVGHTHTYTPLTDLNFIAIDTMPNYYIVQELEDSKVINETIINNTK